MRVGLLCGTNMAMEACPCEEGLGGHSLDGPPQVGPLHLSWGLDSSEQLTESSSFWNEVWASGIGHEKGAGDGLLSCPKLGQSKTTN